LHLPLNRPGHENPGFRYLACLGRMTVDSAVQRVAALVVSCPEWSANHFLLDQYLPRLQYLAKN